MNFYDPIPRRDLPCVERVDMHENAGKTLEDVHADEFRHVEQDHPRQAFCPPCSGRVNADLFSDLVTFEVADHD